jgi:ketosteroid isomerase-like protein
MRKTFAAALLCAFAATPAAAQPAAQSQTLDQTKAELRSLLQDLSAALAKRDRAALERIYSPEFIFVHGFGYTADRDTHIQDGLSNETPTTVPPVSFDPPNELLVYGDTAVLRNKAGGGRNGIPPLWNTTVYAKKEGRWQIINVQSTPMQPPRAYVNVSTDVLDRYVGRYDRGGGVFTIISRDGNDLVVQHPGLPKRAIRPMSPSQFFDKLGGEWTFQQDIQSKSTSFLLRAQGRESKGVKVVE